MAIATVALLLLGTAVQAGVAGRSGIRSVDFRSYTYCLARHDRAETVTLVGGRYRFADDPEVAPGLSLLAVQYGRLHRNEPEEALVVLRYDNAGSALHHDYLFVFSLGQEGPELRYSGDYEAAQAVAVAGGSIRVRAPFWLSDDPHCCPTYDARYTIRESRGRLRVVALSLKRRSSAP
jgi:hypothetical protein